MKKEHKMGAPTVSQESKSYKVSYQYAIQKRRSSVNPDLTYKLQGKETGNPNGSQGTEY